MLLHRLSSSMVAQPHRTQFLLHSPAYPAVNAWPPRQRVQRSIGFPSGSRASLCAPGPGGTTGGAPRAGRRVCAPRRCAAHLHGHVGVPDSLRIDNQDGPVTALVEAAGMIHPDLGLQLRAEDGFAQEGMHLRRPLMRTGSATGAYEEMNRVRLHAHLTRHQAGDNYRPRAGRRSQLISSRPRRHAGGTRRAFLQACPMSVIGRQPRTRVARAASSALRRCSPERGGACSTRRGEPAASPRSRTRSFTDVSTPVPTFMIGIFSSTSPS